MSHELITPLVPSSIPPAIRELGPVFVDFVKAYYEWLETSDVYRVRFYPGTEFVIGTSVVLTCTPGVDYLVVGRGDDYVDLLGDLSELQSGDYFYTVDTREDVSGTASIAANSRLISGNGTSFATDFEVGDYALLGNTFFLIDKINDDESITASMAATESIDDAAVVKLQLSNRTLVVGSGKQPNVLAAARDIAAQADVDTMMPSFLTQLKKQYLANFPETMAANPRHVVKHILDLYRTKGTKRAIKLLFRILFNEDIDVIEPWRFVFKPSSADWFIPRYLEVGSSPHFFDLPGKVIHSSRGGATAIVENVHTRIVNGQSVNVVEISRLNGRFHYGERVLSESLPSMIGTEAPVVLGSLTAISIDNGGSNYELGDVLRIVGKGAGGIAKVIGTTQSSGRLSFEIIDGGSGYTLDAVVTVAGDGEDADFEVGSLTNIETIVVNDDLLSDYLSTQLDEFSNGFFVAYSGVANGTFTAGDYLSSTATVLPLDVEVVSGVLEVGETVTGTGVSGTVVLSDTTFLKLANTSGTFANELTLTGGTSGGVVTINTVFPADTVEANGYIAAANSTVLTVVNTNSISDSNWIVDTVSVLTAGSGYSNSDYVTFEGDGTGGLGWVVTNNTGNVVSVSVVDAGEGYTATPNVDFVSAGTGATAAAEIVMRSGYYIYGTALQGSNGATATCGLVLRRTDWGFPDGADDNLDGTIIATLHYQEYEVGTIASLARINPGFGYSTGATVTVVEPDIAALGLDDGNDGIKGQNAIIEADGGIATGVISAVAVSDSGVAYEPGEHVELINDDNATLVSGRAVIDLSGEGTGRWRNNRGFTSSDQKIQDSYYYQKFSYDIAAPRMLRSYEKFVRDIVHLAGFKMFGQYTVKNFQAASTDLVVSSFAQT